MGSKVLASGTDFNPTYTAATLAAATICSRDTGTTGTTSDDLYYLNVDGANTVVATFDVRLTTAESRTAGTLVGSSDTDVGQTFNGLACTAFATNLRFLEGDGLPGWTAGDMLVWSADNILGVGDVRLTTITGTGQDSTSVTAGSVVATGNADLTNVANNNGLYPDCTGSPPVTAACASSAILQGAGMFALRHYDANLNLALDSGDTIYAAYRPDATPAPASPSINDVYLHAGSGGTFGTRVTRSSTDYLVEPEGVCGTPAAMLAGCFSTAPVLGRIFSDIGSATNCDRLVIHFREFDGAPNVVLPGDIIVYSPAAGITSCPSPVPASSVASGTVVNSVALFQGTPFQAVGAIQIFYVDLGNGRYDLNDPVYLNKPAALGGSDTLAVSAGDVRLTSVTIGTTFSAGTVVGASDADVSGYAASATNPDAGTQTWFVRKLNIDGANEIALNVVPSVMFHDVDADGFWDPGTESVYRDVGTSATGCTAGTPGASDCVSSGDFLLYAGSDTALAASSTTAIDCATGPPADCAFLATTLLPLSDVRVTGTDTTIDASRGETLFYSRDAFVNDEDFAFPAATASSFAAGQVSCAANGCDNEGLHTSDVLYVSRCPTAGCPGRLLVGDVQVSPTVGARVASSGADFVPSLLDLPTVGGMMLRYNRGDGASTSDDTFYASTDGVTPTTQDLRLTTFLTQAPGTVISSTDTEELTATMVADGASLASRIAARDTDGLVGYTLNDAVYVNNAGVGMGGTAADAVLSAFDLRLTSALTFSAGTMVFAGNADLTAGSAFTGLGTWLVGFHDDNRNGVVDSTDVVYALPPGTAALSTMPQPPLGAVRLSGSGVASGGGGGGGGGTTATTTATTTASTTTTTSSTDTTTSTSTDTTTSTGTSTGATLASINQALADSLMVTRSDGVNTLMWDLQPGVAGYQIFSSDSPFVLLGEVPGDQTTFEDTSGGKGTFYLVTAFFDDLTKLTADMVNNGEVPGYSGVPTGEKAPAGKKGFIPAPGLAFALLALGAAFVLVRRKL